MLQYCDTQRRCYCECLPDTERKKEREREREREREIQRQRQTETDRQIYKVLCLTLRGVANQDTSSIKDT